MAVDLRDALPIPGQQPRLPRIYPYLVIFLAAIWEHLVNGPSFLTAAGPFLLTASLWTWAAISEREFKGKTEAPSSRALFLWLWGGFIALHGYTRSTQWGQARGQTYLHAALLLAVGYFLLEIPGFLKWLRRFISMPVRAVFATYFVITVVATLVLILPVCLNETTELRLVDALFTTVSAISVTGLTTVPFTETFSRFGQVVILLLIQLGGLGIVLVAASAVQLAGSRLKISQILVGQELYDVPSMNQLRSFLFRVAGLTLAAEAAGAGLIYFSLPPETPGRLFHSLFHAVSAFCNAGFSTFDQGLQAPGLIGMKAVIALLVILGGLGFPTLFALAKSGFFRLKRECRGKLPATALLSLTVSAVLWIGGATALFLIENRMRSEGTGIFALAGEALFHSISARTAGFDLTPMHSLAEGSQLVMILLMIVGGGPISTAGGIKTTTLGVLAASGVSLVRGLRWAEFHRAEIPSFVLQKAVTVLMLYLSTISLALIMLSITESASPWALLFEAVSALSTVGLTTGVTPGLSLAGKLIITGLMMVGRMGVILMVVLSIGPIEKRRFRYSVEHFHIG